MTIESLKTQRANIRRNISRIRSVVDPNQRDEKSAPSQAELKCRLEILEAYFKQAISVQTQIEKECSEAQIAQAMLIAVVMGKVDPETKREWNKSLDYSTLPTWKLCMQYRTSSVIRCNQFKDMTVTERYEAAKRLSLCLNCLGKGHLAAV
ncbi:hypothetical protein ACLKA6_016004 [Drosophila palustris]